ncbi:MAG TPA: wax ester/triacylglycerol synthase domain-containing protein [Acidimicrobiales bacterium]|nr:wax ester/triacylglycerol synthase domain-containing protein [Acidimicrobiales bacterium]
MADKPTMDRNRELNFGRRMSDQEALMWNIEKDPWMNPNGSALTILDRPVDFDLMVAKIRYGLSRIPRLRERPVPGLGRLSPPVWATDPDFDLAYHMRHLALPAPGSMRQLLDLITRLHEEPFDRTRPLWMFYAIEGLVDGEGALFSKQHHSVADGIGALRMAEVYTDLERDVARPPEVDLEAIFAEAVAAEQGELLEAGADMSDSILDTATRTVRHNLRRQGGIVSRAAANVASVVTHPAKISDAVGGLVGEVRSAADTAGGGRTTNASAPLFAKRSRRRHLEVLHVSLDDAKAAAKVLGGSVNDFFVAGAAIGALAYHAERKVDVEAINLTFVVSTRSDKGMGGNSFTPVPLQVPGEPAGIVERFAQVRDLMAQRRDSVSGRGAMSAIAGFANLLPTSVTTRVARDQAGKIDVATSNLRGAPFQTYMAGAKVLSLIPLGPVAGTAANLTTISNNGSMDMGLLIDPAAVEDPAGLARNISDAYTALLEAGGIVST